MKAITSHSSVICFGPGFAIWKARSQRGSARGSGNSRYQFPAPARSCGGTERPPAARDAGAPAPENIPLAQRLPKSVLCKSAALSPFPAVVVSSWRHLEAPSAEPAQELPGTQTPFCASCGACRTAESRVSRKFPFEQRTAVCKHSGLSQAQILSIWGQKPVTATLFVTAESTRLAFPSLANRETDSTSGIC